MMEQDLQKANLHGIGRCHFCFCWPLTSCKWGYEAPLNGLINMGNWGYVITLLMGVITPFITGSGAHLVVE